MPSILYSLIYARNICPDMWIYGLIYGYMAEYMDVWPDIWMYGLIYCPTAACCGARRCKYWCICTGRVLAFAHTRVYYMPSMKCFLIYARNVWPDIWICGLPVMYALIYGYMA